MIQHTTHVPVLVIGYGNDLRRDDGIGPYIARTIAVRQLPSVRTLAVHQLMPELAEDLTSACAVVFVDAGRELSRGGPVTIEWIGPRAMMPNMTHVCQPGDLLELARVAFGKVPEAWSVVVAGEDFGAGAGLSRAGRRNAGAAAKQIEALVRTVRGRRAIAPDHVSAAYRP